MTSLAERATGALWAFHVAEGAARPAAEHEHHGCLNAETGWAWLHFPLSDARARVFIERHEGLPEAARETLLGHEHRVQMHTSDDWFYGVLPDWEREFSGEAAIGGRLYFAFDGRTLFTARRHALECVDSVRRGFERGVQATTPSGWLQLYLETYFEHAEARILELTGDLDAAEDKVLSGRADPERLKIGPIRRELSRLHREFLNLRGAMARAQRAGQPSHFALGIMPHVAQMLDDIDREAADGNERARLLHEEIGTLIDSAANKNLRLLTVLSTLLLPPTLIVGAFGMNVEGVPFAHDPQGFAWACGLCAVIVALGYIALKRSGALR
jgi:zinc transporter